MKQIFTFLILVLFAKISFGQSIARWNFFGESSPTTSTADAFNSTAITSAPILSRGAGAASSTASNSFRTTGFQNNGIAIANTDYFQFSLTVTTGNTLSLSQINSKFAGTASFMVTPGVNYQFAYSLNGSAYTLINSPSNVIGTPATGTPISISSIGALQNIAAGTVVTFRFFATGQTTTGGFGFTSATNAATDDGLELLGTSSPISGNSTSSNIITTTPFTPATNIDYKNFQATDITDANSVELGQFTIQDGGGTADGDALGTILTSLGFTISNGSNLRRLAIYDGATEIAEIAGGASVSFTGLTGLTATDDGSKTFSLRATFNSAVTDNAQVVATINSAGADAAGSSFAAGNAGAAATSNTGDDNRIEVTADRLAFVQNTTTPTGINSAMAPSPSVSANDINNNRDLDYVANIDITSTGTLGTNPTTVAAVNGLATFGAPNAIIHTVNGTGLQLTAASGALNTALSNLFDISLASATTDYFRSKQTGNWGDFSTWESSSDETTWINATLIPTSASQKITITTGNTVTINVAANADNLIVNGTLSTNLGTAFLLTLNDGTTNPDMTVNGTLQLNNAYASCWSIPAAASVLITPTGRVKVDGGGGNQAFASNTNVTWSNASIYEWNTVNTPSFTGITYFATLANATDIPVFKFSAAVPGTIGGATSGNINGKLESAFDLTFGGNSSKVIRNGISNNGNITFSAIAANKLIINGATAVLEGTGTITTGTGGLEIGSATGTNVSVNNNKTIVGSVSLVNSAIVTLSNNNLITNGLSGGSSTALIVTNGTGVVTVKNLGTTPVTFPVGANASTYTPATLTNNGTVDNFSVRTEQNLPSCLASVGTNSITALWDISEETAGGSNVDLSLDYGASTVGATYSAISAKIIHCTGATSDYSNGSVSGTVASGTGFTNFSPFGVSSDVSVLPIKLTSFTAINKVNSVGLNWNVALESGITTYEVERSINGTNFTKITTVNAQNLASYTAIDNSPVTGNNYYRLKINENNGTFTYSAIQKVKMNGKALTINAVYPSPAKDFVKVNINNTAAANATIEIVDFNGKTVLNNNTTLNNGLTEKTINISTLKNGIYIVKVSANGETANEKFVKQ